MRTRRHKRQKKSKRRTSRKIITRKRGGGWFDFLWKSKDTTTCDTNQTISGQNDQDYKVLKKCCEKKTWLGFGETKYAPFYDANGDYTLCGKAYNSIIEYPCIFNCNLKEKLKPTLVERRSRQREGFPENTQQRLQEEDNRRKATYESLQNSQNRLKQNQQNQQRLTNKNQMKTYGFIQASPDKL